MGLLQTTNKSYWRNFGCFSVFFVPFGIVLPAFFEEGDVFDVEIMKISDKQRLFLG